MIDFSDYEPHPATNQCIDCGALMAIFPVKKLKKYLVSVSTTSSSKKTYLFDASQILEKGTMPLGGPDIPAFQMNPSDNQKFAFYLEPKKEGQVLLIMMCMEEGLWPLKNINIKRQD